MNCAFAGGRDDFENCFSGADRLSWPIFRGRFVKPRKGRRPDYINDPVKSYRYRKAQGRQLSEEEVNRHMQAVAEEVDRETAGMSRLYLAAVAQLLGVYEQSLTSGDLIAKSRGLGETIRSLKALGLLGRAGLGSMGPMWTRPKMKPPTRPAWKPEADGQDDSTDGAA